MEKSDMARVNIAEAKSHLSRLIEEALSGEEVVIARRGVPLVRLEVIENTQPRRLGAARGLVEIAPDFDAPLDDFSEYR
jgi:prevent-host-death family protein